MQDCIERISLQAGTLSSWDRGMKRRPKKALAAWPGGMQIGGGIRLDNAGEWLDAGAAAVIVTSWVFYNGKIDKGRLRRLSGAIGKERLVLDLSCRRREGDYIVVTDR